MESNLKPFKPGETGNPNGRPKGARSMKTILREALELLVEVPNNEMIKQWSKENKLPIKEVLVLKELSDALKGNDKAKTRVWEYVEGRPSQSLQLSGDEEKPLQGIINITKTYATKPNTNGKAN